MIKNPRLSLYENSIEQRVTAETGYCARNVSRNVDGYQ